MNDKKVVEKGSQTVTDSEQRWHNIIKDPEHIPKDGERVLVYIKRGFNTGCYVDLLTYYQRPPSHEIVEWGGVGFYKCDHDVYYRVGVVTHWMRLPDKPSDDI